MTKFFIDTNGNYLGGYDGDDALATVPQGAIEIPAPPPLHASQVWNGTSWSEYIAQ